MTRRAGLTLLVAFAWPAIAAAQQRVLAPASSESRNIAALTLPIALIFAAVSIVMWALILWVATRRTGSFAAHVAWNDDGGAAGTRWIQIGGVAIPVVMLTTMLVASVRSTPSMPAMDERMPEIRVIGHQWWWEVHYLAGGRDVTAANEIHLPVGRRVAIELVSRDVIHSFWLPELQGKVDLIPGITNHVTVEPTRIGTFTGECAEYCGPEHALMRLVGETHPEASYQSWIAHQAQPAAAPATGEAAAGAGLFLDRQCAFCHTIRGTAAAGQIGPDLTHVGSRAGLASNAYPNDVASLSAWVTHAQSMKPYAGMPNMTVFTGQELRSLVAYLRQLQ